MNDQQLMMGEFTWTGGMSSQLPKAFSTSKTSRPGPRRAATAAKPSKSWESLRKSTVMPTGGNACYRRHEGTLGVRNLRPRSLEQGIRTTRRHWVARRVPDDQVFVGANRARIGVVDFADTENFMFSTDITKLPEQMGWWKPGTPFHYADIFNPILTGTPTTRPGENGEPSISRPLPRSSTSSANTIIIPSR